MMIYFHPPLLLNLINSHISFYVVYQQTSVLALCLYTVFLDVTISLSLHKMKTKPTGCNEIDRNGNINGGLVVKAYTPKTTQQQRYGTNKKSTKNLRNLPKIGDISLICSELQ